MSAGHPANLPIPTSLPATTNRYSSEERAPSRDVDVLANASSADVSPANDVLAEEELRRDERPPAAPSGSPPPRPGRGPESRHWLSLIIVAVLAFAIIVPPLFNIERYQHRIADNISRSLGRPVHFSRIHLRLLPRPGFDLSDFTIDESPEFGSEPILHSSSVSASVRLLSLWRGKLEIARIALEEPSLNLARNAQGRWNFASVMTQASRTTIAPTGQMRPSRTPRFPYIEASNARVNFKFGNEKQPFSFLNGDLAIWLENPSEWQLRFKAQPVRTDLTLNVADTGLLRIEGSMQRAASLGDTPLNLRVDWERAPLGQVGRLVAEEDPGWRGDLEIRSKVKGTPDRLSISADVNVGDLHRVEFEPEHALDYAARCTATYEKARSALRDLNCELPVGRGTVTATGLVSPQQSQVNLVLAHVPASAGLNLLRLMREHFARDVSVQGDINGHFALSRASGRLGAVGSAAAESLTLQASGLEAPLAVNGLRLTALSPSRSARAGGTGLSLLLAPIRMNLGSASPLIVDGRFDKHGFLMHYGGSGALGQLVPLMHSLGPFASSLQSLQPVGEVLLDVQMRGRWLIPLEAYDSDHPLLTTSTSGTFTLQDASLVTPYLSGPLAIHNAEASLFGTQIAWSGIVAQYGPVHFTGNFRAPLPCPPGPACVRQFDLSVASLDLAKLPGVMVGDDPLVQVLLHRIQNGAAAPEWPALHGTIRASTATLGTLSLQDAVATIDIAKSEVKIDSLDAHAMDGSLHLSGIIHAGPTPAYSLDAQLNQAAVPAMAQLFHQAWGSGVINLAAHVKLKGLTQSDLLESAQGMYHFDWSRGGIRALGKSSQPDSPFSHFEQWTADGTLGASALNLEQSLLTTTDGAHSIQGTIGFDRQLDLKSSTASSTAAAGEAATLTGTLTDPVFELAGPAQP